MAGCLILHLKLLIMCITFGIQFDTHALNYTALYPMIPQSRYLYNNFTLNFNDETYVHTYIQAYILHTFLPISIITRVQYDVCSLICGIYVLVH